jgi:hypothetical protein
MFLTTMHAASVAHTRMGRLNAAVRKRATDRSWLNVGPEYGWSRDRSVESWTRQPQPD